MLAVQGKPTPAWCSSANSLILQVRFGMVAGQVLFGCRSGLVWLPVRFGLVAGQVWFGCRSSLVRRFSSSLTSQVRFGLIAGQVWFGVSPAL